MGVCAGMVGASDVSHCSARHMTSFSSASGLRGAYHDMAVHAWMNVSERAVAWIAATASRVYMQRMDDQAAASVTRQHMLFSTATI